MPEEHRHHLSQEAFEQLCAWLEAHCCACALEDPQFVPGLIVVVELEVERALKANCWKALRILTEPCRQ